MNHAPNILVVDDDAGITSVLCAYLARFGFKTQSAGEGAQMQCQLDAHCIALVVLDLMLPGVDGLRSRTRCALARASRSSC